MPVPVFSPPFEILGVVSAVLAGCTPAHNLCLLLLKFPFTILKSTSRDSFIWGLAYHLSHLEIFSRLFFFGCLLLNGNIKSFFHDKLALLTAKGGSKEIATLMW